MALNMTTDKKFDAALAALARKENKTKSAIIRELVMQRSQNLQNGFVFSSLAHLADNPCPTTKQIVGELKKIDEDHDLD